MLDSIAQDLGVEVDEPLVESGLLRDMQDLRELQRLMEDLQQAFQFPEMQGGLPGDENPDVASLGQGVMGAGTSLEDLLFGHQGPRWDGVGMDVESFGGGKQGNRRYPSAEPCPSGSAAPNLTPQQDRDASGKYSYVITTKKTFQRDGQHVCIVTDTYIQSHGPSAVTLSTVYIDGEQHGQYIAFSENGETFGGGEVVEDIDFPIATPEEADLILLGELRSEETTLHEYPEGDDQPNPEGDGAGGPAGGQREFLDWLTGRPPKAGNQALNRPIGKMDVLGQPGAG